ncbi:MAG TPA: hypothetical protein VFX98_19720 [Longimicrobiaceae bacterium]|nr:hypothetical protein [Longimicrobiaceae bacterium]
MKTRMVLVTLLALAVLPGAAAGQRTPEQRIAAARQRAETTGIPVQLLDDKVAEGRAKGVPPERIAAAVERRLTSLTRARQVMANARTVSASDISVGADAVEAGVSEAVLSALATRAPPAHRSVAIFALTELVRGGAASEVALERVQAALERGPEALRALPGQDAPGARNERGPPPGRGQGQGNARGRGRGQGGGGGPPSSVPGPSRRPERDKDKGGKKP